MTIEWNHAFNSGDICWIILGSVVIITCLLSGFALLYSAVAKSNIRDHLIPAWSYLLAFQIVAWCGWGYSFSFAPSVGSYPDEDPTIASPVFSDIRDMQLDAESREDLTSEIGRGGLIGNFEYALFASLFPQGDYDHSLYPTRRPHHHIPHVLFFCYQMTLFLTIPIPLLIAFSRRLTSASVTNLLILWTTLIYFPLAHWVWGSGWLDKWGTVDPGGGLMHVAVGLSGVVLSYLFREKTGSPTQDTKSKKDRQEAPDSVLLGMGLLLLGISAVNATARFHANGTAVVTLLNTIVMGAAGLLASRGTALLIYRQTSSWDAPVGLFVGLTTSSACAGCISFEPALTCGVLAGAIGIVLYRTIVGSSDHRATAAFFSVQLLGGTIGMLSVALFASSNLSGRRWDGIPIAGWIESGQLDLLSKQALAIAATIGLAFLGTLVFCLVIRIGSRFQKQPDLSNETGPC